MNQPQSPQPPTTRVVLHAAIAVTSMLSACASWPLYSHLPQGGDPQALPAGSDSGIGTALTWSDPQAALESKSDNGLPIIDISAIALGNGLLWTGTLNGAGWLSGTTPDRTASCGGELAFPNSTDGSYAGDVDWVAVEIGDDAFLCATLVLDRDDSRTDLVPYGLDDCDEPATLLVDAGGLPFGFGLEGATTTWSMPVTQSQRVGIALAAYWPQDPTAHIGWEIGLSLSATGTCPALPAAR